MIQDATGNEIMNAAKCEVIHEHGEVGIEAPRCDEVQAAGSFDLFGRRLNQNNAATGLTIRDGKIIYTK